MKITVLTIVCAAFNCVLFSPATADSDLSEYECGVRRSRKLHGRASKIGKIVGGKVARKGDFPWIVSIQDSDGKHFCGGSIINPDWILTASHCFHNKDTNGLIVSVGSLAYTEGQKHDILKVITHEGFRIEHYQNDVALLKISPPISFTKGGKFGSGSIGPVCLPNPNTEYFGTATVAGWGFLYDGSGSAADTLQAVDVNVFDSYDEACLCRKAYDIFIPKQMICAGWKKGAKDACQGDSGGPLVGIQNDRAVLVGVVSYGEGCAEAKKPGVYSKVSNYLSWISDQIKNNP